jgi:hypothetical protein
MRCRRKKPKRERRTNESVKALRLLIAQTAVCLIAPLVLLKFARATWLSTTLAICFLRPGTPAPSSNSLPMERKPHSPQGRKITPDGTKTAFSAKQPAPGATGENGEDTSTGLPAKYAKDYLVASSTTLPNKEFAVINPTLEAEEAAEAANHIKDYVVALQPFTILGELQTKYPYFQNESHGGLDAEWSDDSSVALITLDGKWGPHDVFLLEFRDGKLARTTNVLAKAHDLLLPGYRKSKAEPYNDNFDFIFDDEDGAVFKLDGANRVVIDGEATTDPKGLSDHRWSAQLKAVWDVSQGKFTSQKITRTTAKQSN